MNTVGPVAVEDYLSNVATLEELEKFKKLIETRKRALEVQQIAINHHFEQQVLLRGGGLGGPGGMYDGD